jgi:hypothetical protein
VDLSTETYCRQVEAYLCRKNDGHLVRIVGPAFEQVCGWATRGVPLTIAQRGIDRYFERYYAKGPRRRPVRVEFCEADVMDVFDEWRRAVGLPAEAAPAAGTEADRDPASDAPERTDANGRRHGSLPAHLERSIARLTALRAGEDRSLDPVLEAIVRELDGARATVKSLRGPAREALIERLSELDRSLMSSVRARHDEPTRAQLALAAAAELAPFRARMSAEAFARAQDAAVERAIRERLRLPTLTFE